MGDNVIALGVVPCARFDIDRDCELSTIREPDRAQPGIDSNVPTATQRRQAVGGPDYDALFSWS